MVCWPSKDPITSRLSSLLRAFEVNIVKLVKVWLKTHPWPEETMKLGPGSCGGRCRKQHAHAYCVGQTTMLSDEVYYYFVYDRPCNVHESAWDRSTRKEMGL